MKTLLLPVLLAGGIATAPALPAAAQDDRGMDRRNAAEFERGYREGREYERRQRDPTRQAYERGYREGRLDEQRATRGYGYGTRRLYGWGEERFEREGVFGGLFGDREMEFDD